MMLKIDVDGSRKLSRRELERRARIAHVVIMAVDDRRSPSGRGWHRRIEIERVSGAEPRAGDRTVTPLGPRVKVTPETGQSIALNVGKKYRAKSIHRKTVHAQRGPLEQGIEAPDVLFSPVEIVVLQLLFGSDPIREAFNLHRARLVQAGQVSRFWARRWNTLYATSGGR